MIELQQVQKSYPFDGNSQRVLHDLDLHVEPGEFVAIMGPSGAGKTTLLNLIAGLDLPDGGQIEIAGQRMNLADETWRTLLRRQHIGLIFQFFQLVPSLSIADNVALPLLLTGTKPKAARQKVDDALAFCGIGDLGRRSVGQLSGGQLQLACFARAIAGNHDIILADEPTGSLNTELGFVVLQKLRELNRERGTTIVLVTHRARDAGHADRIVFLKDGRFMPQAPEATSREALFDMLEDLDL